MEKGERGVCVWFKGQNNGRREWKKGVRLEPVFINEFAGYFAS